jgi:hypothetical protein
MVKVSASPGTSPEIIVSEDMVSRRPRAMVHSLTGAEELLVSAKSSTALALVPHSQVAQQPQTVLSWTLA